MKKIVLFALLLTTVAVWAQPHYATGLESKKMSKEMLENAQYLGQHNGLDCWVTRSSKSALSVVRKNDLFLVQTDQNLEPLHVLELPRTSQCELLTSGKQGNKAFVVMSEQAEDAGAQIYTALIDLDSMKLADGATSLSRYDSLPLGKKDKFLSWAATSPNGQFVALITVIQYAESQQYSAIATLFDDNMRALWNKEYAIGSMHQVCATNDGRIVTIGYENASEETHFIFNIMSATKADSYDVTVKCDPIMALQMVNIVGSRVLAMGTFQPAGYKSEQPLCGGAVALSFDINTATLVGFSLRPFQNEDINILENEKTRKVQREQVTNLVSPVGFAPTAHGAVMAVSRCYEHTYVEANGTSTYTNYAIGLHVVAIDDEANISWVRNLRRNDLQLTEDDLLCVSLQSYADKVYLFKNESTKYPSAYEISKPAKELKMGGKSNLVMYAFGPDGEVSKTIIEAKTKQSLINVMPLPDNSYRLVTLRGHRTRVAELNVK